VNGETGRGGARDRRALLLAAKIKQRREERGLTIRALARAVEMSPSMVSEVEKGIANPSVETLAAIVKALDLSLEGVLEGSPAAETERNDAAAGGRRGEEPILRRAQRHRVTIAPGVRRERLSPAEVPRFEFALVTYEPGAASCEPDALIRHRGLEYGLVMSGRFGLTAGFDNYELKPGDSIRLDSSIPHRVWAIGDEPATVLWTVLERGADPRQAARPDGGSEADLNPGGRSGPARSDR
jgi:transcriptional regulator with XRE-family HTH domain